MDMNRSYLAGADSEPKRSLGFHDLPPCQAGLSAALRRAFAVPVGNDDRPFEELLRKLG